MLNIGGEVIECHQFKKSHQIIEVNKLCVLSNVSTRGLTNFRLLTSMTKPSRPHKCLEWVHISFLLQYHLPSSCKLCIWNQIWGCQYLKCWHYKSMDYCTPTFLAQPNMREFKIDHSFLAHTSGEHFLQHSCLLQEHSPIMPSILVHEQTSYVS